MSRHHRNIEEEFRAIAPPGYRGIPSAQPIAVGVTGSGGADSSASMSQASQEISQLETQFKQQATLIQANTQALQDSTTTHAGQSVGGGIGGSIGGIAGGILGGGLGILSPVVSGLLSLFGVGGSKAPAPVALLHAAPQRSDERYIAQRDTERCIHWRRFRGKRWRFRCGQRGSAGDGERERNG